MNKRFIEKSFDKLIPQCMTAYDAIVRKGPAVGLLHNTALNFGADLFAVTGTTGEEGVTGTQNAYNEAKASCGEKRTLRRSKEKQAKETMATVINLLKPVYGPTWNSAWEGAGFTQGTLRQPKDPLPVLIEIRDHLRSNPLREVPGYSLTANIVDVLAQELSAARTGLVEAISARKAAKEVRDAGLTKLYHRMVGVRRELLGVLSETDNTWWDFGLARPVDGKIPLRVKGLALRMGGPGEVIASWSPSSRAENYRVRIQPEGDAADPVEVAFASATVAVIVEVPLHTTLNVFVTAVNTAGETVATKQQIVIA